MSQATFEMSRVTLNKNVKQIIIAWHLGKEQSKAEKWRPDLDWMLVAAIAQKWQLDYGFWCHMSYEQMKAWLFSSEQWP